MSRRGDSRECCSSHYQAHCSQFGEACGKGFARGAHRMGSGDDQRVGLPVSRHVRRRLGTRMHICLLPRKDTRHDPAIRIPSSLDFGSRDAGLLLASRAAFSYGASNRSSWRILPAVLPALLLGHCTWTGRPGRWIPIDILHGSRDEPRDACGTLPACRVDPCSLFLANSDFRPESFVRLVAGVRDYCRLARTRSASLGINKFPKAWFARGRVTSVRGRAAARFARYFLS
jgi:hypothetical protein